MMRYDILPETQRALLLHLRQAAGCGYALYGGTAVALRLGHRESIDFDFFGTAHLDERELVGRMPLLKEATTTQRAPNTWTVLALPPEGGRRPVKISFFGGLDFGRVGTPEPTTEGELQLASPLDLLGHKLKVLLQRVEAKDYRDIAELLRSGLRIEAGLGAAQALFGANFPPAEALRTMTYFEGGNLGELSAQDRETLVAASGRAGPIIEATILSRDLVEARLGDDPPDGGPGGGRPGRRTTRTKREHPGPPKGESGLER